MSAEPEHLGDTAEIPVVPAPTYPPQTSAWPAATAPEGPADWGPPAPAYEQPVHPREERRTTIRRASGTTRMRAWTTTVGFLTVAAALWLANLFGVRFGISYGANRLAFQLPLVGLILLALPTAIRLRVPMAWLLPVVFAAATAWATWGSWQHAHEPLPTTCGTLGELLGSCDFRIWPWWVAVVFLGGLTIKCLTLAWSVYEDSITVIEVDRRGRR